MSSQTRTKKRVDELEKQLAALTNELNALKQFVHEQSKHHNLTCFDAKPTYTQSQFQNNPLILRPLRFSDYVNSNQNVQPPPTEKPFFDGVHHEEQVPFTQYANQGGPVTFGGFMQKSAFTNTQQRTSETPRQQEKQFWQENRPLPNSIHHFDTHRHETIDLTFSPKTF